MRPPNLLFLMTDQQRGDTTAPDSLCQMPNLRALAEAGTQFERAYAPNPICSPTRASLMTGLLPHSHGMVDCTHTVAPYRAELNPDLAFWSRRLQASGYFGGYFGKWHIERSDELDQFGFDIFETSNHFELTPGGYRSTPNAGFLAQRQALGLSGMKPQLKTAKHVPRPGYDDLLLYGISDEPVEATMEYYNYSRGIDFIRERTKTPDQPWQLFLSTFGPHDPYIVPQAYYDRYAAVEIPKPASFDDDLADRPGLYRRMQRVWDQLSWEAFAEATRCYYATCSLIDDQIGRIIDVLREVDQLDNTIIVFTSDHGDYMGAHRLLMKGIPAFEEAYRVPLVMCGPGIPPAQTIDRIVSLIDVAPTLVALTTGAEFDCQGRSLLPLLQDQNAAWNSEAFAEMQGQRFAYTQRILWRDQYKYVFNTFDEDELYDLAADPHELHNLALDPDHRPVLESMAARMWAIMRETDDFNMVQSGYGTLRFAPVGPVT